MPVGKDDQWRTWARELLAKCARAENRIRADLDLMGSMSMQPEDPVAEDDDDLRELVESWALGNLSARRAALKAGLDLEQERARPVAEFAHAARVRALSGGLLLSAGRVPVVAHPRCGRPRAQGHARDLGVVVTLAIVGARLPEEWRECTCGRGEVAAATDGFSRSSIDDTGRLGTRDIGPNGSAPGSTLTKVAAWLLAKAEGLECSGVSAGWCPVHGDCTCPSWNKRCEAARETIKDAASELGIPWERVKGVDLLARIGDDEVERSDPSCPLHRPGSAHAGVYDEITASCAAAPRP